ncbi:MAG: RNA polymerase sigma factor [Acidimicrobiales bacterium]|jgi:RNA polymerase sigma-70 factor (ECF subfamily)
MRASDEDEEDLFASLTEPARFTSIFERHVSEIHRYLSYRVGADLADDLTAETFLRAFKGRWNFEVSKGDVAAWLFGIATNLLRHHRRDEQRRFRIDREVAARESPLRAGEDFVERIASRSVIGKALGALDAKSRDVVVLVAGAGLTYEQAASALAIPLGTVRSRLSRARNQVRSQLGPEPDPLTKGADPS